MTEKATPSPEAIKAWARLMRVSRQLVESAEDALKDGGLPPLAWYDVLHELAETGEGGLRPFQLTERTLFAQYNISRLLARLEADGLVEKLRVADDGRGQTIRITGKGRETRRRMWAVYGPSIAELVGVRLSASELETLSGLLGRLRHPAIVE
ncbi:MULTISPECIES: MarR family winged helix-turn-helix transcriptional regulator [unclassified Mesorhizobium]|uniref:MarR family winged helix-turn-helix transcriptional regulator n=1 Tax=unclassified Mesorhizobium TaxID=325217 RepID=UPI000FDC6BE4|nr:MULTISPECIES: MarR family winged helix-turn-helix transcriptional regulator [unclassified Mesorhizobium]TGQ42729.1 MarR family transcriptional regulator [Mesorhizobium sp. M00.F.Ca.ET.216.01.1.1]TIS54010.1 MAG: winged helix-turn-helix transcriptional regulator [Mesorhizobium sp.]TIS86306.1 MAG: winged helix-turn-helix transcriptional regulator [Mesorhizobium sp.]TJW14570.1 MAG: winged helix-turn-helix transcriptional regulator [Mesorhizobium sp.]TJW44988.1 MAG: winged helix-turn-helix trans